MTVFNQPSLIPSELCPSELPRGANLFPTPCQMFTMTNIFIRKDVIISDKHTFHDRRVYSWPPSTTCGHLKGANVKPLTCFEPINDKERNIWIVAPIRRTWLIYEIFPVPGNCIIVYKVLEVRLRLLITLTMTSEQAVAGKKARELNIFVWQKNSAFLKSWFRFKVREFIIDWCGFGPHFKISSTYGALLLGEWNSQLI